MSVLETEEKKKEWTRGRYSQHLRSVADLFETCVHAIRQRVMTTFWLEAQYSCVEALVYTTYVQETKC